MPNKRTDLDRTISRLQKNARNKIYRLRKAGASESDIAAIDPRMSTKGMNGSQKAAYARKLQRFNGRSTGYSVTSDYFGNVAVVPTQRLNEYRTEERKFNKWISAVRRNAVKKYGGKPYFSSSDPTGKTRDEWERVYGPLREDAYNAGYMEEIHREYGFGSARAIDAALARIRKRYDTVRKLDRNLGNYKKYIVNKMRDEGSSDAAVRAVNSLTRNQLQYLYYNSDFSTIVETYHYKEYYYAEAHFRPDERLFESTDDMIIDMVKTARRYAPKGRFRGVTYGA